MEQANPDLSWRDVMEAIVQTAATIDPGAGWTHNEEGFTHSYEYGHGLIDALEAVSYVTGEDPYPAWQPLLGERAEIETIETGAYVVAPGETKAFTLEADANMRLEHVELLLDVSTDGSEGVGALEVEIERVWPIFQYGRSGQPKKTVSVFATTRTDTTPDYDDALFTSVRHWGENADATWKVRVKNTSTTQSAIWNSAELRFYGTAACVADWDMNGVVDGDDQIAYTTDHGNGEPFADLNHDQIVDQADLDRWDDIFLDGCP